MYATQSPSFSRNRKAPQMAADTEYMTVEELRIALNISRATLYTWRRKGIAPPSITLGRQMVRFRKDDVDKWLEERRAS